MKKSKQPSRRCHCHAVESCPLLLLRARPGRIAEGRRTSSTAAAMTSVSLSTTARSAALHCTMGVAVGGGRTRDEAERGGCNAAERRGQGATPWALQGAASKPYATPPLHSHTVTRSCRLLAHSDCAGTGRSAGGGLAHDVAVGGATRGCQRCARARRCRVRVHVDLRLYHRATHSPGSEPCRRSAMQLDGHGAAAASGVQRTRSLAARHAEAGCLVRRRPTGQGYRGRSGSDATSSATRRSARVRPRGCGAALQVLRCK